MKDRNDLTNKAVSNGNSGPWVFLACRNVTPLVLQRACQLFQVETKKINEDVFCFSKDIQLNHKEKALILFYTGLYLGCRLSISSFCLGQFDMMGEQIKQADLRLNETQMNESKSEDWLNWQPVQGHIWISEPLKYYLEHAGIAVKQDHVSANEWVKNNLKVGDSSPYKKVG